MVPVVPCHVSRPYGSGPIGWSKGCAPTHGFTWLRFLYPFLRSISLQYIACAGEIAGSVSGEERPCDDGLSLWSEGYVVDYVVPLECGGPDVPLNMREVISFFIRRGTLGKISAGSRWVAAFPCHSVACYENKSSVKRLWFLTSPQSRDFVVLETTIVLYACAGAPSVAAEPVLDRAGGF